MRARVACGIVVGAMLMASSARADNRARPVKLVYARDASALACPDEVAIRRLVHDRIGYEPFDDDAEATLTTTIGRARRGLVARIELHGPGENGKQELSGGLDCTGLTSALVVAMVLAIDPLAFERQETPPAPTPPEELQEPTEAPVGPGAPPPRAQRKPRR